LRPCIHSILSTFLKKIKIKKGRRGRREGGKKGKREE
jgi:hypothetical protein